MAEIIQGDAVAQVIPNGSLEVAAGEASPAQQLPTEAPAELALREAQEKLRTFREKRDAATLPARVARETALTLQRLQDEQKLAELEDEHGAENLKHVFFDAGIAVVKRPKQGHYIQYANKGKEDYHSQVAFVAPCLVWPALLTLEDWLKKEPFKITNLAGCCCVLAGVAIEDSLAK
jgi:hypothetical protein